MGVSELPFNSSDHGLPTNTENTEALPLNLIITLFHASVALEAPFRRLIRDTTAAHGSPPLCIISDVFMGCANKVANSSSTVNVAFSTGGAYGTAAYMSMWQHLPHRHRHRHHDADSDDSKDARRPRERAWPENGLK